MTNFTLPLTRQARFAGRAIVTALVAAVIAIFTSASSQLFAQGVTLNVGDIVYADSGDAVNGGFVLKVDPTTQQVSVISHGGFLSLPFDVVVTANGEIIVSDSGRLIGIDPATGAQTLIVDNSQGTLGSPYGLTLSSAGYVIAANLQGVVAVDPSTGQAQTLFSAGSGVYPVGVALDASGGMYVLTMGSPAQIVRVNLQNGGQKVISKGGYLKSPQSIAIDGDNLYVTDVATPDGNFGVGRVIQINVRSGKQRVVAEAGYLVGPVGIAVDGASQLIVGDPYTGAGYEGAIIQINPLTSAQNVLAVGQGSTVNPRGVAIVGKP